MNTERGKTAQAPVGFEAAHAEWLRREARMSMTNKYRHGAQPVFYETAYWKRVREAILLRDCYRCRRCGNTATQVHHLTYLHRGEDHFYPEFLVSVCHRCHVLVEFARLAQSCLSTYRYRLARVQERLSNDLKSESETPLKSLSRLLEYRKRLDGLCKGFEGAKLISNSDSESTVPSRAPSSSTCQQVDVHHEAQAILDSWKISGEAQSRRILKMITDDILTCEHLISEALGTIPDVAELLRDQNTEAEQPNSDHASVRGESLGPCPECGGCVFEGSLSYACQKQVKNLCTFRVGKVILSQRIELPQIIKLLAEGKSDLLDRFVSFRTGQRFQAFLTLKNGELKFDIQPSETKAKPKKEIPGQGMWNFP